MPMIEVKLYDRRVTEEAVPRMIEALTKALADTSGADPELMFSRPSSTSRVTMFVLRSALVSRCNPNAVVAEKGRPAGV